MSTRSNGNERSRTALALSAWENEGGAPAHRSSDHQYGRRIEADRSWTVYHVFTGVPARIGSDVMKGLSRSDATGSMLCLNLRKIERSAEQVPPSIGRNAAAPAECQS